MYHVGIDIGGTFTDFIALEPNSGEIMVEKVPSTPRDPSIGFMNGLDTIDITPDNIDRLVHGTTVATNAVLEHEGAPCGLLTTDGFQDVLELGRRDRPDLWGLEGDYEPIVPRKRCRGINERVNATGEVVSPPSPSEVRDAGRELLEKGVETVVISFLHSYANPENEKAAMNALEEVWPNDHIIPSSEVLPEFREFDRTSTAVAEGYTRPVISNYLNRLEQGLEDSGYEDEMMIMQSNGGLSTSEVTKNRAARTLLSGPAGGATAASYIAEKTGHQNVISCDMGGTSFDVGLLPEGEPIMTQETELDYQVPVRIPMIDISAIGAGGGSIANVDEGGILHTGPESAGAEPGPVCYGKGGTEITTTDANLVLQRINAEKPIGDNLELDADRTRDVMESQIGDEMDLSIEGAAQAVIDIGVDKMGGKIRELSIGQGYDPREFTLVVFGGAGPLHAGELIKNSDVPRAIIPYFPGILSALGCVMANSRHDNVMSVNQSLGELDIGEFHEQIVELEGESRELLSTEADLDDIQVRYKSDMKYMGQSHTVTVPFASDSPTPEELREQFRQTYLEHYSEEVESEVFIDNVQVTVVGVREKLDLNQFIDEVDSSLSNARIDTREVYFDGSWYECPIYDREKIPLDSTFNGPAILEQADTTTVVNPGMTCTIDEYGNAILEEE